MSLAHGWLPTSIEIMHLHAYFAQAIEPGKSSLLQFPTITEDSVKDIKDDDVTHLLKILQEDRERTKSLLSAASHIGRLDVVDAQFKGMSIHRP
jgi:hypothetical protein